MSKIPRHWIAGFIAILSLTAMAHLVFAEEAVIGLNYPKTGPYSVQGLDQFRAAMLALEEINASGGILGGKVGIVWRDSQSNAEVTRKNVADLIDNKGAVMVFGGSSSSVAIAAGEVCRNKDVVFFGTLTYSTDTTGIHGNRHIFRECYNSWMGAKAIGNYLQNNFPVPKNKYFYITADYTWGHTTESAMRHFTSTGDTNVHRGIRTPFPNASENHFRKAMAFAKMVNPDVLVLVLFGKDMSTAIRMATITGLKKRMQIVVPNLTLGMAEGGGPKVMEGVIGALPWCWRVPYAYNYPRGIEFVEKFVEKHNRYPSTSGASAYTIMYQYKEAVERAGTFDTPSVIRALEGHTYVSLKDSQTWRKFDHQSVQTVYSVKCKPEREVLGNKFKLDYFGIIGAISGEKAVRTREEWNVERMAAGKPAELETLPGDLE